MLSTSDEQFYLSSPSLPAAVIQQAVWLYFRFPLSLRDVEDMLSQRGIDVSYETVRRWSSKFGLANARKLRSLHPCAGGIFLSQPLSGHGLLIQKYD